VTITKSNLRVTIGSFLLYERMQETRGKPPDDGEGKIKATFLFLVQVLSLLTRLVFGML